MNITRNRTFCWVVVAAFLLGFRSNARSQEPHPLSDPANAGGWILNKAMSDEYDGRELDASKWLVQGTAGEYRSRFIGRAPSQFSTRNVGVEDGKLKFQTRWEPDFPFSNKPDRGGRKYENVTTAAVISKKQVLYGYMEIKCKAADASVTSSFWATGHRSELDGCEWNEDSLKFYADGQLVGGVRRAELGARWVLKNPLWIWVDSETFPWHGLPQKEDLPVDFEIEYIRVWQQRDSRE